MNDDFEKKIQVTKELVHNTLYPLAFRQDIDDFIKQFKILANNAIYSVEAANKMASAVFTIIQSFKNESKHKEVLPILIAYLEFSDNIPADKSFKILLASSVIETIYLYPELADDFEQKLLNDKFDQYVSWQDCLEILELFCKINKFDKMIRLAEKLLTAGATTRNAILRSTVLAEYYNINKEFKELTDRFPTSETQERFYQRMDKMILEEKQYQANRDYDSEMELEEKMNEDYEEEGNEWFMNLICDFGGSHYSHTWEKLQKNQKILEAWSVLKIKKELESTDPIELSNALIALDVSKTKLKKRINIDTFFDQYSENLTGSALAAIVSIALQNKNTKLALGGMHELIKRKDELGQLKLCDTIIAIGNQWAEDCITNSVVNKFSELPKHPVCKILKESYQLLTLMQVKLLLYCHPLLLFTAGIDSLFQFAMRRTWGKIHDNITSSLAKYIVFYLVQLENPICTNENMTFEKMAKLYADGYSVLSDNSFRFLADVKFSISLLIEDGSLTIEKDAIECYVLEESPIIRFMGKLKVLGEGYADKTRVVKPMLAEAEKLNLTLNQQLVVLERSIAMGDDDHSGKLLLNIAFVNPDGLLAMLNRSIVMGIEKNSAKLIYHTISYRQYGDAKTEMIIDLLRSWADTHGDLNPTEALQHECETLFRRTRDPYHCVAIAKKAPQVIWFHYDREDERYFSMVDNLIKENHPALKKWIELFGTKLPSAEWMITKSLRVFLESGDKEGINLCLSKISENPYEGELMLEVARCHAIDNNKELASLWVQKSFASKYNTPSREEVLADLLLAEFVSCV